MLSSVKSPPLSPEQSASGFDLDHTLQANRPRVLVVDDDADYISMMKLILRKAGFDVSGALSCQDALEKCDSIHPDIVLLDVMMPDMDGFKTFDLLRQRTGVPVIFISASPNQDVAVQSLQYGAEDYISKPFYYPEVIARIQVALQRSSGAKPAPKFQQLGLQVEMDTREVTYGEMTIRLLPLEFSCLVALAEAMPRSITYEKMTKRIWGEDTPKRRAHLKTLIFALRHKLEKGLRSPLQIINYRSVGYQLLLQEA